MESSIQFGCAPSVEPVLRFPDVLVRFPTPPPRRRGVSAIIIAGTIVSLKAKVQPNVVRRVPGLKNAVGVQLHGRGFDLDPVQDGVADDVFKMVMIVQPTLGFSRLLVSLIEVVCSDDTTDCRLPASPSVRSIISSLSKVQPNVVRRVHGAKNAVGVQLHGRGLELDPVQDGVADDVVEVDAVRDPTIVLMILEHSLQSSGVTHVILTTFQSA